LRTGTKFIKIPDCGFQISASEKCKHGQRSGEDADRGREWGGGAGKRGKMVLKHTKNLNNIKKMA